MEVLALAEVKGPNAWRHQRQWHWIIINIINYYDLNEK